MGVDRRAVIFKTDRIQCAASINGMPHGGEIVGNNGFAGHFCLHFLGSRLHYSGRMDPTHQRTVMRAARYLYALPPEGTVSGGEEAEPGGAEDVGEETEPEESQPAAREAG